jgi:arylformamidase
VFIHGGYWRMLTKDENSYAADALAPAGATTVVITYSLTPDVHLDVIVRQCRDAVAWTYRNIHRYGGNNRRLYVSGHSAGGHLTGMVLGTDWAEDYGLPADIVKGGTPMSGLFDLDPVRLAFPSEWLQLSEMAAHRNSPVHHLPKTKCPVIVAWGGGEPEGFHWQSKKYADALEANGNPVTRIQVGDLDHFALGYEMADPDTEITKAMLEQMEIGKHDWRS